MNEDLNQAGGNRFPQVQQNQRMKEEGIGNFRQSDQFPSRNREQNYESQYDGKMGLRQNQIQREFGRFGGFDAIEGRGFSDWNRNMGNREFGQGYNQGRGQGMVGGRGQIGGRDSWTAYGGNFSENMHNYR